MTLMLISPTDDTTMPAVDPRVLVHGRLADFLATSASVVVTVAVH